MPRKAELTAQAWSNLQVKDDKHRAKYNWDRRAKTFQNAAIHVLRSSPEPMTISDLMELMVKRGLVRTYGKTPAKSLYTVIRACNERCRSAGIPEIFEVAKVDRRAYYRLAQIGTR